MIYKKQNDYDITLEVYNSFKKKLHTLKDVFSKTSCFLGWDGFIDNLYSLIRSRDGLNNWSRMETMETFGRLIRNVAGSSIGIETILKRRTNGGFTSNVCKGLSALGGKISLVSAWGYPNINEIFFPLIKKDSIEVKSFTEPGITNGLEFNDGKIMLSNNESILKINWNLIIERISKKYLIEKITNSNIIGLGYWSVILQFEDILKNILNSILPSMSNLNNKLLFLDLADTKRRSKNELISFLKFLPRVEEKIPVLLSLNDQEAKDVISCIKDAKMIKSSSPDINYLVDGGIFINNFLNISYLVIHSPYFATITTKKDHYWVTEGFTSKPRYTTSAGDHFNAGTVLGLKSDLKPPEAILMGNAVTAIFVRTGNSPNFQELSQFTDNYMKYIEKDNPDF